MNKAITYNPPSQLPDAEADVLASILRDDGSIEVWEAHCVDGVWWSSNSTMITSPVVSWAHKPEGVDLRSTTGAASATTGALGPAVPFGDLVVGPPGTYMDVDLIDPFQDIKPGRYPIYLNAAPAVPQGNLATAKEIETVIDWCVNSYMPMPSDEQAALLVDRLRYMQATPAAPSQEPAVPQCQTDERGRPMTYWGGYAAPSQEPVTLTDEEIKKAWVSVHPEAMMPLNDKAIDRIRAIIAALREKEQAK